MSLPLHERLIGSVNTTHHAVRHHVKKKIHKRFHKDIHHVTHALAYHLDTLYVAAFALVMSVAFLGNSMFADTASKLKTNDSLIYPLKKVSTFECRQLMKPWEELEESCKINLPIIKNANYTAYKDNGDYKNIYTVLWGATYPGQRDMDKGDHAGVDIASANGTPLYAVAHGVVTFAGTQAGYGNVVKLMFTYQGITYHAVYGHMKSISVSKGDTVAQGQKIGELGNSGSTFGALGGNHVHFEINKDNAGRPAYYYQGCPALATNSLTQITNGGLCREYREKYSFDPILFIENSQKNKPVVIADGHGTAPTKPTVSSGTTTTPTQPTVPNDPTILTNQFLTLRSIPAAKLTQEAIAFLRDWDVQIVAKTSDTMKIGQEGTLTFLITKKGDNKQPFDGVLPAGFTLVSANGSIDVSASSLQYISKGEHIITYKPITSGRAMLAISIGGQTLAVLSTTVQ
ncbi:Peptidase family M23 [candidate division SR1 bacterium Aalborg_AAW-1]|nr:Peptidase family M23 [candidate division SR1 bacterium Aalborg_AAW-1]